MLMGKVVGSVVSTRKNENLVGNKFMIVEVADHMRQGAKQIIAIDKIGAGIGEYVLVVQGSAARIGSGMPDYGYERIKQHIAAERYRWCWWCRLSYIC